MHTAHHTVNPRVLRILATDEVSMVRGSVASNQRTDGDVLLLLGSDEDIHVRYALTRNPSSYQIQSS
ncbi:hypothetical protein [Mycetocola zhujimingii]|uniref:hypothetical protein n=1 Tax=Mycetocola zhujimingii TaxID=2079792 RepID=UPI000D386480|nr:hypothetical protein [Mycetocola zhujimingii]AWB86572.1 hypothetical protein C3E77_08045 [Mycetocola zhujimingii]